MQDFDCDTRDYHVQATADETQVSLLIRGPDLPIESHAHDQAAVLTAQMPSLF